MAGVLVYHGTSHVFRGDIEREGLVPPPGHGKGVRVNRRLADARRYARAYAARFMLEKREPPRGLIVRAVIPEFRLRLDESGILRVVHGIAASEFTDERGMLRFMAPMFADLFDPDTAADALEDFEELTGQRIAAPFPRRRARRS